VSTQPFALTCARAGVDSVWEQEKLEATLREMPECEPTVHRLRSAASASLTLFLFEPPVHG